MGLNEPPAYCDSKAEQGPYAELTWSVIRAGIEVQRCLGSVLLESANEVCLAHEL